MVVGHIICINCNVPDKLLFYLIKIPLQNEKTNTIYSYLLPRYIFSRFIIAIFCWTDRGSNVWGNVFFEAVSVWILIPVCSRLLSCKHHIFIKTFQNIKSVCCINNPILRITSTNPEIFRYCPIFAYLFEIFKGKQDVGIYDC